MKQPKMESCFCIQIDKDDLDIITDALHLSLIDFQENPKSYAKNSLRGERLEALKSLFAGFAGSKGNPILIMELIKK